MEIPRKTPGCGFNKAERNLVQPNKFNNSKPQQFGGNKPKVTTNEPNVIRKSYLASKTCKIKRWDPASELHKSQVKTFTESENKDKREKIQRAMAVFDQEYEAFCQKNENKPGNERISLSIVPIKVAEIVIKKLNWMVPEKMTSPVCGVQIGDTFNYRAQLMMIGLHSQPQSGIDYIKINGENMAVSIVDACRYSNKRGSSDTLVYSGEGGIEMFGSKLEGDQKLVKGNLALKNSKDKKNQVRVFRKVSVWKRYVGV
ncbi:YDG domain-containing protein At5g47150-like [Bidens hawaiensis]|uniref:YDG domain-containing protein At5g47150-like n=1 Tax=Bidens hawaiensis TaxID=980011 RepID=UPI00404B1CEF